MRSKLFKLILLALLSLNIVSCASAQADEPDIVVQEVVSIDTASETWEVHSIRGMAPESHTFVAPNAIYVGATVNILWNNDGKPDQDDEDSCVDINGTEYVVQDQGSSEEWVLVHEDLPFQSTTVDVTVNHCGEEITPGSHNIQLIVNWKEQEEFIVFLPMILKNFCSPTSHSILIGVGATGSAVLPIVDERSFHALDVAKETANLFIDIGFEQNTYEVIDVGGRAPEDPPVIQMYTGKNRGEAKNAVNSIQLLPYSNWAGSNLFQLFRLYEDSQHNVLVLIDDGMHNVHDPQHFPNEPTQAQVLEVARRLRDKGKTIILLATHHGPGTIHWDGQDFDYPGADFSFAHQIVAANNGKFFEIRKMADAIPAAKFAAEHTPFCWQEYEDVFSTSLQSVESSDLPMPTGTGLTNGRDD